MNNTLTDVVNGVILNSSNQAQIAPSWAANAAYKELDPASIAPPLVRLAALQSLTQIARSLCRGKFEPDTDVPDQHELWPQLQTRYPIAHSKADEPVYVKLELLTEADVAWNVQRLEREGATKIKHARALRRWGVERNGAQKAA